MILIFYTLSGLQNIRMRQPIKQGLTETETELSGLWLLPKRSFSARGIQSDTCYAGVYTQRDLFGPTRLRD